LEAPERGPVHSRRPKILYTKNSYSEGVKYRRWQELLEYKPIDVNPFCHDGKVNQFLSHYNRLGTRHDGIYSTTTRDMLEQVLIKNRMTPEKLMTNYYTYNDNAECLTAYEDGGCPIPCANEFLSTMKHSYQVPRPYVMQRLAFPKIPFLQNRKFKQEEPYTSPTKFYGENYYKDTCQLQKYKGRRWVSYNPCTGNYTDST
ncbi:uncharacterized protein BDFB_004826, partial [Asbolus verrucosus]